jgi:large subunit ribosomal protein L4
MLDIPVYNTDGEKVDTMQVDERLLGSTVNAPLLKQAIVGYHANRRQGTVATKGRGMVAGSTRKMFKQKGTGRARRGPRRTPVTALKSAVLAKILGEDLLIVDALGFDAPKTSQMASVVKNLKINRSCLVTLADRDANVYLSSRNIPDLTIRIAAELNAFDVATRQKMLITSDAMKALLGEEAKA